MDLWPHQTSGIERTLAAIRDGCRRLALTSPTGGGKTVMERMIAQRLIEDGWRVDLFTNRKLLLEQMSGTLHEAQMSHGIRAAGYAAAPEHQLQVVSIQTDHRRLGRSTLPRGDIAIVDEGHLFNNRTSRSILSHYRAYLLVTATPLGLGGMADELIQAGTNSELRQCGALVMARHLGPTEPDLKAVKGVREGQDLTEGQQRKAMPPDRLWGNVFEEYHRCNPDRRPAILFGPDVRGSLYFAQRFSENGIRAAHIDGDDVWLDGKLIPSSRSVRDDVIGGSMDGSIKVLCNRFVLREGVDLPWLYHGIFATVFGSLQSYLQAGGRLLRAHRSLDSVVIQDHGGHWWRHGSLNADREWNLGDTNESCYHRRADRLRERCCWKCRARNPEFPVCLRCGSPNEKEPWRCPQCHTILMGRKCAFCGYEGQKRSRVVMMTDGTLQEHAGQAFRPRKVCQAPDGPERWKRMYWRSRTETGRKTFRQAYALFAQENDWSWPQREWPFMPLDSTDDYRFVEDVPMDRLVR